MATKKTEKEQNIITSTDNTLKNTEPCETGSETSSLKKAISEQEPEIEQSSEKVVRRKTRKNIEEPAEQIPQTELPSSRPQSYTPIISIDTERTVATEADKERDDLLDLMESMKSKKILSGTIQGVERMPGSTESYAIIYHGAFKIMIPASEMVIPPVDFRGREPSEVMHYLLLKRMGAEIDYIVLGIDPEGIAAGSRLQAMAIRRREYFSTDNDGNYRIYEGVCAEARVISVIRAGIFVDILGLEVYIPLRELSYQRYVDASNHFEAGQRVLVQITSVDRSDHNNLHVTASIKRAQRNPYEQALKKYVVGNRYVGTVSMVDTNGVFVALDGIDCLCPYPKRGRPPRGARVTVRILGINNDTNRIWGVITHISTTTKL